MKKDTTLLIDNYIEWYKSKIQINELKKADEIITPYTNHLNDRIPIFIIWHNDKTLELTDDGMTLDELDMMGLNYSTETRQQILTNIVKKYSLNLQDNILTTKKIEIKDFPQKKHDMLQAILSIYDLLNLNESNTRSMFKEDVYSFFFEHEFGGNIEPNFTGSSSIHYQMDYSLGATKSRPNIMFQFIRKPVFDNIVSQKFIYEDLKNESQFRQHGLKFVLISEVDKISERNQTAANEADVEIIPFSHQNELLALK
ncbi:MULTISPECIES: DUF1828 domain-containing protein [Aerococcus]|uniref:DUF1828 domain-containing protein n=1 Tax=Aerococcus sanguinicola TaxID=119206 RepID=A0A5N1GPD9_9LACT|nr:MULTISPECIES: DUF1828 domain-containing protein [Aerococcus]KAA9302088.1 DUF1828 domain-containing protein [Aerococcus sanguinicola]MDK6368484.1 DUF1828 domain-containing protein [Aerococcus sp. UMB9870]MDK6679567.1 DUF1828 domain-containing protein [Aerococcus sp. UMB8608]MDK6686411.1 DUF1828 domain-containing protein [Aerococcus sp. UMB8623]MDK6940967.1 DUF1828 domain-containing protein [Aerococcus sp. UMB8487]